MTGILEIDTRSTGDGGNVILSFVPASEAGPELISVTLVDLDGVLVAARSFTDDRAAALEAYWHPYAQLPRYPAAPQEALQGLPAAS